ncbi:hypothetical protein RA28_13410 [Ruegeria sp. ANG-S4]|nr:hypothetical protein RA28_13410 [Ruegeria sp. ANG-S4]
MALRSFWKHLFARRISCERANSNRVLDPAANGKKTIARTELAELFREELQASEKLAHPDVDQQNAQ